MNYEEMRRSGLNVAGSSDSFVTGSFLRRGDIVLGVFTLFLIFLSLLSFRPYPPPASSIRFAHRKATSSVCLEICGCFIVCSLSTWCVLLTSVGHRKHVNSVSKSPKVILQIISNISEYIYNGMQWSRMFRFFLTKLVEWLAIGYQRWDTLHR